MDTQNLLVIPSDEMRETNLESLEATKQTGGLTRREIILAQSIVSKNY